MSTSTTVTEGDNASITLGNGSYTVDAGNNDVIKLGNGSDTVTGGTGNTVSVGNGNDTVSLGSQSSITAGNGNDTLTAGGGSSIQVGNGADTITAGSNSSVQAGNGNDTISVGSGSSVKAGNGNDTIHAGSQSTVVVGNGNDTIYMGSSDTVTVGNGTDKFILQPSGNLSLTAPNSLTLNEDTSVSLNVDVSVAGLGFGQEIIYGFSAASDQLVFNTAQFANAAAVLASASQVGQNTVIRADAADTVTLENVKLSSLSAKDFAFVSGGSAPNVQITISGLPAGVSLLNNSGPLQIVNGSITLTPAQLAGLTLSANDAVAAILTVTATNTVTGVSVSKQLSLTVNEVAAAPSISAPQTLNVNEGGTVALGISASAVEADQNAPSILISGVPADAMLSAGINNHNGTWTLTAGQLNGLQLTAGEEGSATLMVTATDTEVASTASATRSISLTISPPTINVMLAGTAQEGAILTANAIVSNGDAVGFQWQRSADGHNWTPISGATGQTYTVQEADESSQIRAVATLVDDGYSVASAATSKVVDAAPAFARGPTISGMAQEGQTLTASATAVQSDNTVSYQWQANGTNITGATAATYVVQEGDEGKTIDVVATITNESNVTTSKASGPTGTVTDAAPTITEPTITSNDAAGSSTVREGDILTASATARGDDAVTYQWFRSADGYSTAISSGATYAVREADEGSTIEVVATSSNDNNISVTATSAATTAVRDSLPTISLPTIGGLVQDGQTIAASATPGEGDDSVSFAWYSSKDGYTSAIGTGATYLLGEHDEGLTIEVKATVTNDNGETAWAFSAPTVSVAENPNEPLQITIAGAGNGYVLEGQELVAIASDPDDPPDFVYTWQTSPDNGANNDWVTVQSGPSEAYTPTEADENKYLREISVFTDDSGNTETGTKSLGLVIPVSEPPSVSVPVTLPVNEGGTVQLPISLTAYDADDDQLGSTVTIAGLPADAILSAGAQNQDGSWTVQVSDLPGLSVTVGAETAGSFQIMVSATATDATPPGSPILAAPATGQNSFVLSILPEQPSLDGTATSVMVDENGTAALPINITGVDADDVLSLTVSGLPADASLSAGTLNADGSWTLTPDQLPDLQITVGEEGNANLTVTASNSEDGLVATVNQSIALNIVEVPPTVSVTVSGVAKEGQVLTTSASSSDPDVSFTYQWRSSADGGTSWSPISGATGQTYTVQEADENELIDVVATAHDAGTADVSVTSTPTAAVVDNSGISVSVSVPGGNPVQQGQQLAATATITGDTDDAGATISYQWQVSGDGGNTWSNTGPATTGLASNVAASFYQLTEADEGQQLRAVASFTDDTGQVVSAASAPTVAVAEVTPAITVPFRYAVDELTISKNGSQIYDDTFASAPPFSPATTSGAVNYVTLGSTWSDVNHQAIMASGGAVALNGGAAQVIARFNTNTQPQGSGSGQSELGLKQDAAFTVSGTFDLSAPSPVNAFYGIDLTDGSPSKNPADQVVQLVLKKTSTTGGGTYAVQLIQNNQATNTVTVLAQQDITAQMAGNTRIELDLSHAANSTAITGAFELFNNGTQTAATTFTPTGTIFTNGVTYTRAEMLAFAPQTATISGLAQEGQTLTANAASNDADATLHYQWQRSTTSMFSSGTITNIGTDSKTYTLQEADEGSFIRVQVSSTDADGNTSATVTSGATSGVTDQPTTITNLLVNGVSAGLQPRDGDTLTATATVSEPAETVVHYQWQESTDVTFSDPSAITPIGTDNASYTVQEGDEGQSIRVIVTATDADNGGVSVQATSNPSFVTLDAVPSLSVGVSGTAQEGATLTATPALGTDSDGGNAVTYQWQSSTDGVSWNAIVGATGSTYTVQEADEGAELRVSASFVDDTGQQASALSTPTAAVVDNSGISVSVSVPGGNPVQQGQQLAATATITGDADDAGATISYQWQVSGDGGTTWSNTGPATTGLASNVAASFYQLTEADEGQQLRAVASFTDDTGQVVSATSAPTVAVAEVTPAITVPFRYAVDELTISKNGSQIYDDTFASAPPFSPATTSGAVNYVTLGSTWSDVNHQAIMASGGAVALNGGAAQVIARFNTNTQPQGSGSGQSELGLKQDAAFTVSGTFDLSAPSPVNAFYGIDLTDGSPSKNPADQVVQLVLKKTGTTGGGTYAVQLIQNNQATNTVTVLAQQDITAQMAGNTQIEFDLSHVANSTAITGAFELFNHGTQTAATTFTPTGTIFTGGVTYTRAEMLAFAPQTATISGLAQEGQTLTANAASNDADATLHYQWQRSTTSMFSSGTITNIGTDSKTYTLQEADEGSFIRVQVSSTDADGNTSATVTSGATSGVTDQPTTITNLLVNGVSAGLQPRDGDTLTATATVSEPAETVVHYQWQESTDVTFSDPSAITPIGTDNASYTVQEGDEGQSIRVIVTATDADNGGVSVQATSNPSFVTLDAVPSLSVGVSGTAQEGATLTATPALGTDSDGGNAVTYQWQSSTDGVSWNAIVGATGSTYTVQEADEGAELRVSASFVDDTGQQASALSTPTAAVVDNSGISVSVSVPGGNPVQQGQQLAATATITGDADDAGATISYQWQVSGDGGTTWSNTGPATTGLASNVAASFYQLTEADEGQQLRAVASFTDDTGQVVSATSAPTVAVAEVTPAITVPFRYAVDELTISKNGSQIYDDTFASAPPFSPATTSGAVNYVTLGSTWSDVNHQAIMASGGAVALNGGAAQVIARFNTNTQPQGSGSGQSELGLKQDAAFTVSGTFDLSAPSPVNAFYGIDLTDGSPSKNPADQVVQLVLKKTSTTGGGTYAVQLIQNNQATNTVTVLAQQDITAQMAGNTRIELDLSHAANSTAITGAFELFNNGTQTAATTFTPTGTIFTNGVTYTRAEMLAFAPQTATISGLAQEGQTLTANAASNDADATLHYQWQRSTTSMFSSGTITNIGTDSKTYTLQEADEGSFIRVQVSSTDADGNTSATVTSGATSGVTDQPTTITNLLVNGVSAGLQPRDGDTLTATATVSEPAETVVHYQWQESTDVSFTNPNAITNIGTDNASYTVQEGDEGQSIRVIVTATDADNGGVNIQAISNPSLLTLDNSSITVAAISALNGVVQGQQLSTSATITGDADDTGATISYQWQVSGDGGTTWSNTGPATTGLASNVPASFYQLTEADEGQQLRAVASFTDDTGQVVSATSAPTVAVAEVTPAITVPFRYAVDELTISKNGSQIYDDTFASAPPFSPATTSGAVNYVTLGSTWSDVNHQAIMASGGAVALNGGAAQVIARFNTNTQPQGSGSGQSELGLKQDAAFTVSGTFDLSAPSPVNAFYGIDLTDGSPSKNPADQVVQLVLKKTSTTGGGTYAVQLIQNNQATNTVTVLAQQDITAQMAGNTQIEFDLSHVANSTAITGAFELFNHGTQTAATTFTPTGTIFTGGVTYTRAEMLAFAPQTATISGLAQEGQTLTANAASNDADATLHYQWQSSPDGSSWTAIAGAADAKTYTLGEGDEGSFIRVQVSTGDGDASQSASVLSGATAKVADPSPSISVSVSGDAQPGVVLTANAAVSTDADGGTPVQYQWQSSTDGSTWNNIAAGNAQTYTVANTDVGSELRVQVSFSDDTGQHASAASAATAAVTGGTITVADGATVEIGPNVSSGVQFEGSTGTLQLDYPTTFAGTVAGFGAQDQMDLIGFDPSTTLGYSANADNTGGTLSATDASHSANIALLGSYAASSFAAASDGHGGVVITDPPQVQNPLLTQPHA